ncbi:MAG: hypothetical protein KAX20_03950, partial [Candidatus Omnitrophica bacterium]|nr:hypothetical protein [Candidatus Omnitrophota bacterium]
EKEHNDFFWTHFIRRCSFSSDNLARDRDFLKYLLGLTLVRITHVATKNTTDEKVEEYLEFSQKTGCQLTIKELADFDDGGRYREIKAAYPEIFCLDNKDYNIYYMPDNTITNTFSGHKERIHGKI